MCFNSIIANISSHISLTQQEIDFFVGLLEVRTIPRRKYLLRRGDICRYDFYIANGLVKVCYLDDRGEECIIKFAPEDWWVVDLDSFLNVKPAFYYMQAIEDTEVFQISKFNYDLLLKNIPQFYKFSTDRWQTGFIALQQRLMQNLSLTAEVKYQHFREKYPGLDQRVPQKLIASYLGITPVFLSMLRRKWATVS
jgi:CRP-like cAMP-binding protein